MRRSAAAAVVAALLSVPVLAACQPTDAFIRVPAQYESYFKIAAKRCPGVLTPAGLAAQASAESSFDPAAVSHAGAQGMMQIIPEVWQQFGTDADGDGYADPFTAADSVATSAKFNCYLDRELRSLDGNREVNRLAAYNAGLAAVQRYGGVPPYPETEQYVDRVLHRTDLFTDHFATPSAK